MTRKRLHSWRLGHCLSGTVVMILITWLIIHGVIAIHPRNSKGFVVLKESRIATAIVVAYFPFTQSKHSAREYHNWLENLLSFCESPMIIFTSKQYKTTLERIRNRNSPLPSRFIVDFDSPREMPPIVKLLKTFNKQLLTDPERKYHTVDLYSIWCAKSFMLNYSAILNPFRSDFFLYIDGGSFRSEEYRFKNWPYRIPIEVITENRLLLGMIAPLPRNLCPLNHGFSRIHTPISIDLLEGGFIGGSSSTIKWWADAYYDSIHWYQSRNFFIGKDQHLINALALAYPKRILVMLSYKSSPACGNSWFAFGPLLADQSIDSSAFVTTCQAHHDLRDIAMPFEKACLNL